RCKASVRSTNDGSKPLVDQSRQLDRDGRLFDVSTWGGQAQDLGVDGVFVENTFAIGDVAMPAHSDVVITGVMEDRISFAVDGHSNPTRSGLKSIQIGPWI